jgi:hypothetical protein
MQDNVKKDNATTDAKQAYVEMTIQKRQQLVEITEGVVIGGVTA